MKVKEYTEMKTAVYWETVTLKDERSTIYDCCVPVHRLVATA